MKIKISINWLTVVFMIEFMYNVLASFTPEQSSIAQSMHEQISKIQSELFKHRAIILALESDISKLQTNFEQQVGMSMQLENNYNQVIRSNLHGYEGLQSQISKLRQEVDIEGANLKKNKQLHQNWNEHRSNWKLQNPTTKNCN